MPVQQKPSPKVSVIMNCHNSAQYLKEAIDSVYSQTCGDFEIIFWDNASTDASAEIAKGYTDGRLRYFRRDEKTTLGKARNLALKEAAGKYVAFLDCDDIWLPEKLEKQIAAFERGAADFVYSNYYIYNQRKNVKKLAFAGPQPEGLAFEDLFLRYPIGILTVAVKMSQLSEMEELFDESLTCLEEYDLFMRFLATHRARYINEPLGLYRVHSGMTTLRSDEHPVDEQYYVFDKLIKNYPDYFVPNGRLMNALLAVKSRLALWKAKRLLSTGDRKSARAALEGYKNRAANIVFYCLTFWPKFLIMPLLGLWRKYKPF